MGVIYRLKPEIQEFILEQKKTNQSLSCRRITILVEEKFKIKVSKSSINSLIKIAGLSMPVGRRLKRRRPKPEAPPTPAPQITFQAPPEVSAPPEVPAPVEVPPPVEAPAPLEVPAAPAVQPPPIIEKVEIPTETPCTGVILLKALDYLIGGNCHIAEAIKRRLNRQENELLAKTEKLLFMPFDEGGSPEDLLSYLNELQQVTTLHVDIYRVISSVFQEVRCIKVVLSDGSAFYLDGQQRTIWSAPHIPFDFSTTIYNIKSYINKIFWEGAPLALLMAPGYETPSKEFFDFMLSFDPLGKRISLLIAYGNRFEELEVIRLESAARRFFVFGLWPWQFKDYRKINLTGEFKPFCFAPLKQDFYLAPIEVSLMQPNVNQHVTLRGCALKTDLAQKTQVIILTNLPAEKASLEDLVNFYLSHWPNPEDSFRDMSRKIELFTYTAASQRFFSTERLNFNLETLQDTKAQFDYHLKALDLYLRWHILPTGYEEEDFSTIKARFYDLKAILKRQKDANLVHFQPPEGYPFLKDLRYALARLNEREIVSADGRQRLWFSV